MLEIRNVTKIYKSKHANQVIALNNVSINFGDKGMVFLLGKSGSGKSTILNTIGGLDSFDSGEVIVNGRSSASFKQKDFDAYRNTYVGFIFQEYNVLSEFSVEKNIALAMELQGKKPDKERIDALLEMVDMTGFGKRKPNQLSGGQKQRLAIARALIKDPQIIMADEPTGALDSKTGQQVFETLKKLSNDKLVIVVSHDRESAEIYADRIIELKDGKVISDRTKHKTSPLRNTGALTVVNGNIIKVKSGKELTNQEKNYLADAIAATEREVFIIADEEVNKEVKRTARIDDNGNGETYKTTTNEDIILSTEKQSFNVINSRLRTRDAMKMGWSSLKNKKGKLIISIFLTIVSMFVFGFADTASCFDANRCMAQTVSDLRPEAITMVQRYSSKMFNPESSGYFQDAMITDGEIKELQTQFPNYEMAPSYRLSIYQEGLSINSGYALTSDQYEKFGISLVNDGRSRYPTHSGEVAVSYAIYRMVKEKGIKIYNGETGQYITINITSSADLVGQNIPNTNLIISGVVNTGINEDWLNDYISNLGNPSVIYHMTNYSMTQYGTHFAIYFANKDDAIANSSYWGGTVGLQNCEDFSNLGITFWDENLPSTFTTINGVNKLTGNQAALVYSIRVEENENQYYEDPEYHYCARINDSFRINGNEYAKEVHIEKYSSNKETARQAAISEFNSWWHTNFSASFVQQYVGSLSNVSISENYYDDNSQSYPINIVGLGYKISNGGYSSYRNLYLSSSNHKTMGEQMLRCGPYYAVTVNMMQNGRDRDFILSCCDYKSTGITFFIQNEASGILESFSSTISMIAKVFFWIGVVFAIFSILLVMSYIGNSISYKKKEIGVLRALGARGSDVYRIFTWESLFILAIVAVITCILLGAGCIAINFAMKAQLGLYISLLVLGIRQIALVIGLCLLIALIASFLPTRRISRMQPIDAMQERK